MRAILISLSGLALVLSVGCGGGSDGDDATTPQCRDGKDNDGDGTTDFPDDLGCTSTEGDNESAPTSAQCEDGRDNDGDGKTDYPSDPGCFAAQADSEVDDCPSGPNCPQCSDGQDNDENGSMDYPTDPGCESAADDEEFPMNSIACGVTLMIQTLPAIGVVDGTLDASSTSMLVSPCGGGGNAPARAYVLHLDAPKVVEISTDNTATSADTIIDVRSMNCMDAASEIACNDDIDDDNTNSAVTTSLLAGSYYIIVSGIDAATSGPFHLTVKQYSGEGTACADAGDCGPGLVCRTPHGGTADVCSKPVCSDGVDDDEDGDADYPSDPGCITPDDADETDDCPDGPNCPECSDGDDNDSDLQSDYPNDTTCKSAADASESCLSTDGVQQIIAPMTTGDTSTATNDVTASCGYYDDGGDLWYRIDVPALTSLDVTATADGGGYYDYPPMLDLYDSSCGGTSLQCDDYYGELSLTAVDAGTYYILAKAYDDYEEGAFTLNVAGKIQGGARCDGVLAQAGALSCGAGFACKDASAGTKTCQPALCGDGLDNDSDGIADYPGDPGCDSIADDTEQDPATAPVCSNDTDDDGDGLTDYGDDYGCVAASGTSEVFCAPETDPVTVISTGTMTGTTVGLHHNLAPKCAGSTGTANDAVYALILPVPVDTLVIDTIGTPSKTDGGMDTILAVRTPACEAIDLACNDDGGTSNQSSKITMSNVAPGGYAILVDGYPLPADEGTPGMYVLNVRGTVGVNTTCTSPLFSGATPVLYCPSGTTCSGASPKRCQ
jgi:hypothetical protein